MELAGVKFPDSATSVAALELAREVSAPFLFNHVLRTYVFGELVARSGQMTLDSELFFLGAVFHDLGLTERFVAADRFEIDGADAAAAFLSERGWSDTRIAVVWDAIALHSTFAIPQRKQPEIALVQVGAGIDIGAFPIDLITPDVLKLVIEALPRLGFKQAMQEAIAAVVARKPQSAMINFASDIGHRHVAGFHLPNFCDVVDGAGFNE
jgi:hypothetical protein